MLAALKEPQTKEAVELLLETRGLRHLYREGGRDLQVLRGIDLQIPRGKIVSIVGASGAGKSTLLHILGGLQKPTAGEVLFQGKDLYRLSEEKRCRFRNEKIGFIFQFYHLLPELTALENVMLPAKIRDAKVPFRSLRREAEEWLVKLGLGERLRHRPAALSGGEQQRVAIARALMNRPELVLCDEPTGNLDSKTGEAILELMTSLNQTEQMTFLIVTHAEAVAQAASILFRIRDGQLEERV